MNSINLLIEEAHVDYDAYLVLMDLSEETGIRFIKNRKKNNTQKICFSGLQSKYESWSGLNVGGERHKSGITSPEIPLIYILWSHSGTDNMTESWSSW